MSDATDSRRLWIPIGAFGTVAALMVWRAAVAPEPFGGDASQYLAHAWALVEGRAYGDTGYLFRPGAWVVGPPLQPPGLPLLLAPLLALFGRYSDAPTVAMYILFAGFIAAVFVRLRRSEPLTDAAGATLFSGAALALVDAPAQVGSDLGYMLLVWLTVALADRWAEVGRAPAARRRGLVVAALTGATAFTFRLAALPLVPAAALWSLIGPGPGRSRRAWLGVALFWAAVFAGLYFGLGFGRTPGTPLDTTPTVIDARSGPIDVGPLGRALYNASLYQHSVSDALLYPLPPGPATRAYHVVALAVVALGLLTWAPLALRSFLASFTVATAAFLAAAPVADGRYLWVLYPVLALGLARGARLILGRLGVRRAGETALAAMFALTLLAAGVRASRPTPPYAAESKAALWRWAGERVREDAAGSEARVASNRPRHLAWYGDVPAFYVWPPDSLAIAELRPTHIVLDRRAFDEDGTGGLPFPAPARYGVVVGERGPLIVIRRAP